jgi:hypothetical protein
MLKPVTKKHQNYKNAMQGCYGNQPKYWSSLEELYKDNRYCDLITLRTLLGGGGPCLYDLPVNQVETAAKSLNVPSKDIYYNESAPDNRVVLQGEYYNRHDCLFAYSTVKEKMRSALKKECINLYGLASKEVLRSYMTPSSYEDFQALLDLYPDHVVELSIYSVCLGNIRGRNTIVWEVRRY